MKGRLVLPARAFGGKLVYDFPEIGVRGASFKLYLRNELKQLREYHTPVELDNPAIAGRTETGVPIAINTLGRWLFGVPGYAGNATFDGFGDVPRVVVNISPTTSTEVVELIDRLFSAAGGVRRE
jgi:hypothetical protein